MRRALYSGKDEPAPASESSLRWALLPALCCQAAGGDPSWADRLTLAWLLFYAAADVMDSVQDQDDPDAWWLQSGPGVALAAASGLFFSASASLSELYQDETVRPAAGEINADFYRTFLTMCSGQYDDLAEPQPGLEQYWRLAAAKSGGFFALACRAGARLASDEPRIVQAYGEYGQHLGLLIQIRDDLDDILWLENPGQMDLRPRLRRSLPFIYAWEVSSPQQRQRLSAFFQAPVHGGADAMEVLAVLDSCGAALYVLAELERQRGLALSALEQAGAQPPAVETLRSFLELR